VRDYGSQGEYTAILKEYFEGFSLLEQTPEQNILLLKRQILTTTAQIHEKGFACLDLEPKNIIISLDQRIAKIADLSCYYGKNDYTEIMFNDFKKDDIKDITCCFSNEDQTGL
jgi:serine/threonine protein kinase